MYNPNNLTDGAVLTAAHLNHVDDGITANEAAVSLTAGSIADLEAKLQALEESDES